MPISLRSLAHIAIKNLLPSFDAINPIIRELKNMGLSYRYQDMRRDIGSALDWKRNVETSMRFDVGKPLSHDLMVRSWTMKEDYRYRVFGLATYEDTITGEQTTRFVSYYTQTNLPEDMQPDEFAGYLNATDLIREKYGGQTVVGFDRVAVMWNPERGHLDFGDDSEY